MNLIPKFLRPKKQVVTSEQYRRDYASASTGNRYSDFIPSNYGPLTAASQMTLRTIRARAKELQRNNEYASAGVHILASRLLSRQGLHPRFMVDRGARVTETMVKRLRETATIPESLRLLLSEQNRTPTEKYEALVNALWHEFAARADFSGNQSFDELTKISILSLITNGEVLLRRHTVSNKDLVVPLQLQMIESDLINDFEDNFTTRFQGINVDPIINRPISIRVYSNNPEGLNFRGESVDVPLKDIIHLKENFRPGQLRGVSWLATIILTLRDLGKAQSSELSRQAVASLFVAVINGGDKARTPGATERSDGSGIIDATMSPAAFYYTKEGETVTFSNPNASTGFSDFVKINLERIATGLRIPYYALSGDFKNVNFSTSKMAENRAHDTLNPIRQTLLVNSMMGQITEWFIDAIALRGVPNWGLKTVIPPMFPTVVDNAKEMATTLDELNNALISWSEAVRRLGRDPDMLKNQILEDNEFFSKNDLSFSIYNQKAQVEESKPEDEAKPDSNADDDDDSNVTEADTENDNDTNKK